MANFPAPPNSAQFVESKVIESDCSSVQREYVLKLKPMAQPDLGQFPTRKAFIVEPCLAPAATVPAPWLLA